MTRREICFLVTAAFLFGVVAHHCMPRPMEIAHAQSTEPASGQTFEQKCIYLDKNVWHEENVVLLNEMLADEARKGWELRGVTAIGNQAPVAPYFCFFRELP